MKTIKNIVLAATLSVVFVGCAGDRYHRSTGVYIDDKATTTKVKADMYSDPCVHGGDVKVRVYRGKVQLSGFVDTQMQKDRAGEVARRINGVQWVKNDLIVKNQLPQNPGVVTTPAPAGNYRGSVNEPAGAGANVHGAKVQSNVNGAGVSGSVNTGTSQP